MSDQRWISVGERLPTDIPHGYCLVTDGNEVGTANWNRTFERFDLCDECDEWLPTHWMPFPKPPRHPSAAAFGVYDPDGAFITALETFEECEEQYGRDEDTQNRYVPLYRCRLTDDERDAVVAAVKNFEEIFEERVELAGSEHPACEFGVRCGRLSDTLRGLLNRLT